MHNVDVFIILPDGRKMKCIWREDRKQKENEMDKELKQAFEVIEKRTAKCTEGDRHIVVLDRGWIFVGNLSLTEDVYTLTNAVNIRKWEKGGFGALSKSREAAGATLDSCEPIRFAKGAPLFVVPIQEDWHE